jgi:hypothetical protein
MLCDYWSILATARAIRKVGGLERALADTVRGILVWGWGMVAARLRLFASSDSAPIDPRNSIVRRGTSHAAPRSKVLVRKSECGVERMVVETWQNLSRVLITRPFARTSSRSEQQRTESIIRPPLMRFDTSVCLTVTDFANWRSFHRTPPRCYLKWRFLVQARL